MFLSFYLDEAQHPIKACREYTKMFMQQEAPQYLPLPSYTAFYRKVQTAIPKPVEIMGREGMKAFRDRCAPYIRRTYEEMSSNDWWIADNHKRCCYVGLFNYAAKLQRHYLPSVQFVMDFTQRFSCNCCGQYQLLCLC